MEAMIIIALILLFLILLSLFSVKLYVKYENEVATIKVGYLFFRFQVFPLKEKKPKKRKKKKKATSAQLASADKEEKQATPQKATKSTPEKKKKKKLDISISEIVSAVCDMIRASVKPAIFALRHAKIHDLDLKVVVGGEEPDETAILYGRWNAAVYGGLAVLRNFVDIKCKRLTIAVDFTQPETTVFAAATFKMPIYAALITAIRVAGYFLVNVLKKGGEIVPRTA